MKYWKDARFNREVLPIQTLAQRYSSNRALTRSGARHLINVINLGNLIESICCLFCMNDAEEVHRFYGSFRPVVKAGECVWIINSFHSGFRTLWSWQQCKCEPNLMPAYLPSHQSVSSAKCKQSIKQNIKQNIKAKYFSAKYNKWAMQI